MEEEYKRVEALLKLVIEDLFKMIDIRKGEDISYYHHSSLNCILSDIIKAKAIMAIVDYREGPQTFRL